ncbi:helix-turn-helix transcriptional regulator [Thauera sp.]
MSQNYLTPDDVAALIPGVSRELLAKLRYLGTGPTFLKPTPRTVLYREADVIAWVEASERTSTADARR